ncbi:MAG: T9SS type A sorting domain-containing protein [Bacteroidia bacterium]|nr:T9SS type A sorting domain-containing protein [Bacteroidia bacterium]
MRWNRGGSALELNLSHLNAGVYVLKLRLPQGELSRQIVRQ